MIFLHFGTRHFHDSREKNEEKASFLAHFGAGFLVWFVYLLGLGAIAANVDDPWRFKLILGWFHV